MRIKPQRPEIGKRGIGKGSELGREDEFSVTAQRHALSVAFLEGVIIGLAPEAGMFGDCRRNADQKSRKDDESLW
jgi:hypothetical protein